MPTEIERKFLISPELLDDFSCLKAETIVQAYLQEEDGTLSRVRVFSKQAFLTRKGPLSDSGLSRTEEEERITLAEAKKLFAKALPGRIVKKRYVIPIGAYKWEIDVFLGANRGLLLAEIELPSEITIFARPEGLQKEITGIWRYYNESLFRYPYSLWTDDEKAGK